MNCRTVHDSLAALPVLLLLSLAVTATPGSRPTAITWTAPEGCPSTEAFVAAMRFRTERITVVAAEETPTAWVDAAIERLGTRFSPADGQARVGSHHPTARGHPLRDGNGGAEPLRRVVDRPGAREDGPAPGGGDSSAAAHRAADGAIDTAHRHRAPATRPRPVRAVGGDGGAASFRLWGAVHATTAISGLLDVGGTVSLSLTLHRFLARLSLGGGSGSTVQGTVGRALYPFHLLASAEAGLHFSAGVFVADATVAATALVLNVTSVDAAEPQRVWRWLLPVGPALRAGFRVGGWLFGASVFAGLNTRRDTYQVTPDGDVFTTPAFFIHPALFVSPSI